MVLDVAWAVWLTMAGITAVALVWWFRRTGEGIAPYPIVIVTLAVYFLPRAAYLLLFGRAPLTSGGLPPQDQWLLIRNTLALGTVAISAFILGHGAPSARLAAQRLQFSLPEADLDRAVWIATGLGLVGLAALAYIIRAVGGVSSLLKHQYELTYLLKGKLVLFDLCRLLTVPTVLLLIDPARHRSRWWGWVVATGVAALVYTIGHRALLALALGYPIALYHLTVRRIRFRWQVIGATVVAGMLLSLGYLRQVPADRLGHVLTVLSRKPAVAIHALNATGEFKVFDAATILVRDVPQDFPYTYGSTFVRIPWMVVPRALWADKPSTLGNVIVQRYLHSARAGFPPSAVGEFYAAAGPFAVLLGFLGLGWVAPRAWGIRAEQRGPCLLGLCSSQLRSV